MPIVVADSPKTYFEGTAKPQPSTLRVLSVTPINQLYSVLVTIAGEFDELLEQPAKFLAIQAAASHGVQRPGIDPRRSVPYGVDASGERLRHPHDVPAEFRIDITVNGSI